MTLTNRSWGGMAASVAWAGACGATTLFAQAGGAGQGSGDINIQSSSPSYVVDIIVMTVLVAGALFAICRGSLRRT